MYACTLSPMSYLWMKLRNPISLPAASSSSTLAVATTEKRRCIAVVGASTAGHVYPALAVAEAYRAAFADVDLIFIGTAEGFEARLVPPCGYRLEVLKAAPLYGVGIIGKLWALARVVTGMIHARRLLKVKGVKMVIGFGGYVAAGTILAAWSLGLRTAIHEANMLPGRTNRMLARFVDRIYLTFQSANRSFPVDRTLVTGQPVRAQIANLSTQKREPPVEYKACILVTGGSKGSPFPNRHAPELLQGLKAYGMTLEVRHQVGEWDGSAVRSAYSQFGMQATVVHYIDDMAEAYHWADFALACAGSGTIAELATCGLPTLLVPLSDAADDHQTANAKAMAQAGALWVSEADWDVQKLVPEIARLLNNPKRWHAISCGVRHLATPGAARNLVADCESIMLGRW